MWDKQLCFLYYRCIGLIQNTGINTSASVPNMLEELGWFIAFLLVFVGVHYQFKYCIPITLWSMKFFEACLIILLAKLYVVFRIYGQRVDLSQLNVFVQNFINATREGLMNQEL